MNQKFRKLTPAEAKKKLKNATTDTKIYKLHPSLKILESKLCIPADTKYPIIIPKHLTVPLLDYQIKGLSWMVHQEKGQIKGGILADEMGMGKTVQMIALILSGTYDQITLIVVPTIALEQWAKEVKRFTEKIEIYRHYGRNRIDRIDLNNEKFTVIITTYGTVEHEHRHKKNGILFNTNFYRIVLDEAHMIKDNKSKTNSAVTSLKSVTKWGMTGTPVQNRVSDLYTLVKFLRIDPHSYYYCKMCECRSTKWLENSTRRGFCGCGHFSAQHFGWWNRKIIKPVTDFGYTEIGEEVFNDLQKITSHIILRRNKSSLDFLPLKTVKIISRKFSKEEKDFYDSLYMESSNKFNAYRCDIGANYAHIFELLQKMRMATNHPFLVQKRIGPPMCGFCNEEADDPVISKCKHIFCREEARVFLAESNRCPVCKVKITIDLFQNEDFQFKTQFYDNWRSSTKIEILLEKLTLQKNSKFLIKTIVFSQYVGFLEMLRWRLERAGFNTVCIYGCMPITARKTAIDSFNEDPKITVFLISLKAGGVALNLTAASQVFIMDLWWNPAVEEQAMDRIHRIGQNRPISIYKVVIEDSVENKVLKLQEKKKALADSAVGNDINALNKLTEDDLMFLFS